MTSVLGFPAGNVIASFCLLLCYSLGKGRGVGGGGYDGGEGTEGEKMDQGCVLLPWSLLQVWCARGEIIIK